MRWPRIYALLLVACGSSSAGAILEDAGHAPDGDAQLPLDTEPACIEGLPPFVVPAYAESLPVEPKVLWTKPLGFADPSEHVKSPLLVTQERIVLATQYAVYLYDRTGEFVARRPLSGLDAGRVPMIAAPDGAIYVGSVGLDRIHNDGTFDRYYTAGKSLRPEDGERGSWVSGIARDPKSGNIYSTATDGFLRVISPTGGLALQVSLTGDVLHSPLTLLGIGDTLLSQGTLFSKNTGVRIGPSFIGNSLEGSFHLDAHGRQLIAPIAVSISEFRLVDSCRKSITSVPQFGATSRPTMTTFQDDTLWAEGVSVDNVRYTSRLYVTDGKGNVVRKNLDFRGWPVVLGADGTLYSLGKENGQAIVLATDEQWAEHWRLPMPAFVTDAVGLSGDGVLVVLDAENKRMTAFQTQSPGYAPVARARSDTAAAAPQTPLNWVGEK